MLDVLRADFYHLRKSKRLYVLFAISTISVFLLLLCSHLMAIDVIEPSSGGFASLFADTQMMSLLGCIVIGVVMGNDFEEKVIEQEICVGHSRASLVFEKGLLLLGIIVILFLPYMIASVLCIYLDFELFYFMKTPWLALLEAAREGESLANLLMMNLTIMITYTAQISIGLLFLFQFRKPAIIAGCTYVAQLILGPVAFLNDGMGKLMSYTPFGIDVPELIIQSSTSKVLSAWGIALLGWIVILWIAHVIFHKKDIK